LYFRPYRKFGHERNSTAPCRHVAAYRLSRKSLPPHFIGYRITPSSNCRSMTAMASAISFFGLIMRAFLILLTTEFETDRSLALSNIDKIKENSTKQVKTSFNPFFRAASDGSLTFPGGYRNHEISGSKKGTTA